MNTDNIIDHPTLGQEVDPNPAEIVSAAQARLQQVAQEAQQAQVRLQQAQEQYVQALQYFHAQAIESTPETDVPA